MSPRVDRYHSLPHYGHHLDPVWAALPDEVRGHAHDLADPPRPQLAGFRPVLVASYADFLKVAPRPVVLLEHGAGQTYRDGAGAGHPSYPGGAGLERVILFVAPSERVAGAWRGAYPSTPVAVVGSPRLDRLAAVARASAPAGVAITAHWPVRLGVPEARPALDHYLEALGPLRDALAAQGAPLVGHGHPRALEALSVLWRAQGIPVVAGLEEVVARSLVLVGDNTSALYEWAALDRPTVVLNAPWYRRGVDHGLRFWDLVPGPQVDHPSQLVDVVLEQLADPGGWAAHRAAVTGAVYAQVDGHAADRAAAAIVEVLRAQPLRPEAQGRLRRGR